MRYNTYVQQINSEEQTQSNENTPQNSTENAPIELKNNKSNKITYILVLIILILLGIIRIGFFQYQNIQSELNNQPVIETSLDSQPIENVETKTTHESDSLLTFTDLNNVYSFQYPKNFELGNYFSTESPALNNRIVWNMSEIKMSECRGDCPIIELQEDLIINNYIVTMYEGYIGEIGGNIPQSFINYEIKNPDTDEYFSIYLWELEQTKEAYSKESFDRNIGEISQNDRNDLLEIVNTFKFL